MPPSIYHPFVGGQGTPVLLYLPRGPILTDGRPEDEIIELLSSTSKSTIVRINYRLGGEHHYPTPIHDVLAGYDWVKDNVVSGHARVGVCGELIGGGLASMLCLTENRMGRTRVAAAAVGNPIVDWVFPPAAPHPSTERDEHDAGARGLQSKRKGNLLRRSWFQFAQSEDLPVMCIKEVRDACFERSAAYLDPFASPVLFFRTAGADLPLRDSFDDCPDLKDPNNAVGKRKAYRVFPPLGSGLLVPDMRISIGTENILRNQGEELAKLMRKSFIKQHIRNYDFQEEDDESCSSQDTDAGSDFARIHAKAEEKVSIAFNSGGGLWCSLKSRGWHTDIALISHWFRTVLP